MIQLFKLPKRSLVSKLGFINRNSIAFNAARQKVIKAQLRGLSSAVLAVNQKKQSHINARSLEPTQLSRNRFYSQKELDEFKNEETEEKEPLENSGPESFSKPELKPFPWLWGDQPPRLPGPLILETYPSLGLFGIISFISRIFFKMYSKTFTQFFFKKDYFDSDFIEGAEIALKTLTKAVSASDLKTLEAISSEPVFSRFADAIANLKEKEKISIEILRNYQTEVSDYTIIFGPPDLMSLSNKDFFPIFFNYFIFPASRKFELSQITPSNVAAHFKKGFYFEVHVAMQVKSNFKQSDSSQVIVDKTEERIHWLTFSSSYIKSAKSSKESFRDLIWKISDVDFLIASENMEKYFEEIRYAQNPDIPRSDV